MDMFKTNATDLLFVKCRKCKNTLSAIMVDNYTEDGKLNGCTVITEICAYCMKRSNQERYD